MRKGKWRKPKEGETKSRRKKEGNILEQNKKRHHERRITYGKIEGRRKTGFDEKKRRNNKNRAGKGEKISKKRRREGREDDKEEKKGRKRRRKGMSFLSWRVACFIPFPITSGVHKQLGRSRDRISIRWDEAGQQRLQLGRHGSPHETR